MCWSVSAPAGRLSPKSSNSWIREKECKKITNSQKNKSNSYRGNTVWVIGDHRCHRDAKMTMKLTPKETDSVNGRRNRYGYESTSYPWSGILAAQLSNDCYKYPNNKATYTFAQPGRGSGAKCQYQFPDCMRNAAINDLKYLRGGLNRDYYSFKIFPQFWLAKRTRIIHQNQLLMTKFGRILCLTRKMRSKMQPSTG